MPPCYAVKYSEDEVEQKSDRVPPHRRRRRVKRTRHNVPAPPAVVDDNGDDENFIGRVVSLPSLCIGERWSFERYGSKCRVRVLVVAGKLVL